MQWGAALPTSINPHTPRLKDLNSGPPSSNSKLKPLASLMTLCHIYKHKGRSNQLSKASKDKENRDRRQLTQMTSKRLTLKQIK
jgi:hypothetical protein